MNAPKVSGSPHFHLPHRFSDSTCLGKPVQIDELGHDKSPNKLEAIHFQGLHLENGVGRGWCHHCDERDLALKRLLGQWCPQPPQQPHRE